MAPDKPARIVAYLVAAVLLMMGAMKFVMAEGTGTKFVAWGYPAWFAFVTGALEMAAAGLLVAGRTRLVGAALAAAIMVGAVATHLRVPELGMIWLAVPLLAASAFVAWRLRPSAAPTVGIPA